jgi:hypothetical protein
MDHYNKYLENVFFESSDESDSNINPEDILEIKDPEHLVIPNNLLEHESILITSTPPISPSKMSRTRNSSRS